MEAFLSILCGGLLGTIIALAHLRFDEIMHRRKVSRLYNPITERWGTDPEKEFNDAVVGAYQSASILKAVEPVQ